MTDQLRYFRSFHFTSGELARVRAMCRANGTSIILPYDQFIEHDCRHLEAKSDAGNPHYIMQLADEGGYNAVAVHYGVAMRAWTRLDGKVPLVVKLNGKTSIPSDAQALSTHTSWVEDAVRIGAVGVGYTLYYGSPRQDVDIEQLAAVRRECERYGMPLIVWAYPRGEAVNAKGGRDTSYMVESATRMAVEMGATVVKANVPKDADAGFADLKVPGYYKDAGDRADGPGPRGPQPGADRPRGPGRPGRARALLRRLPDGRRRPAPQGPGLREGRRLGLHLRAQHVEAREGLGPEGDQAGAGHPRRGRAAHLPVAPVQAPGPQG